MLIDHWPLTGLRLRTARLELRLPSDEELGRLGDLAAGGVHDPELMPFAIPWTDLPPAERARSVIQHQWLRRGSWSAEDWTLHLAVFEDGQVLGVQSMEARQFAALREVHTASWLGIEHHGRGIGTEMRSAVLQLAFAGLGALEAASGGFEDNPSSLGVSRKLGYQEDGIERNVVRGHRATTLRMRLSRADWEASAHRAATEPATITGLDPCLPLFGLPAA